MKHFLRMKNIDTDAATNSASSLDVRFFTKLLLSSLLFFSVFSAHFYYETSSSEVLHLRGASVAFASPDTPSSKEGAGHQALLDINKASSEELMTLPGIGPKLAKLIMRDREANGPFKNADGLLRIKGIGQKKLEKISPFLKFNPAIQ